MSAPWRDTYTSPPGAFPRCTGYVKAMGVRVADPDMTDYWLAVLAAEAFTDDELVAAGTVDFATMSGTVLLGSMETLLRAGRARKPSLEGAHLESLKAFFGSRGIKASTLKTDEDFWTVAHVLWPSFVKKSKRGPLAELHATLRSMSKKQRQAARANIGKVPAKYFLPATPEGMPA